MRVHVDEQKCQGHTLCNMVLPAVFKLSAEDGHSYVEDEAVRVELEAGVRKAALGCPEQAIIVIE